MYNIAGCFALSEELCGMPAVNHELPVKLPALAFRFGRLTVFHCSPCCRYGDFSPVPLLCLLTEIYRR